MGGHPISKWNWEAIGLERWKSVMADDSAPGTFPRHSLPSLLSSPATNISRSSLPLKLIVMEDKVKRAEQECAQLRKEANDLYEYANAKLSRVRRYLTALADKAQYLDQVAIETEEKVSLLVCERRWLFDDLLAIKGNLKVFCRTRPLFEYEGPSAVEFPDTFTIRLADNDSLNFPKINYKFDKVYGPHVGQVELFADIQPFVQSALDGNNVSLFVCGQTCSGKTYTLEGSSHDRGLYLRCFEELFDLSNLVLTNASRFNFDVTAFELSDEKVRDLLADTENCFEGNFFGVSGVQLFRGKVDKPMDFSKILKSALGARGKDTTHSHLIVMIHIQYHNTITEENLLGKLSLVDVASSEGLIVCDDTIGTINDLFKAKSLAVLGTVLLSPLASKNENCCDKPVVTELLVDFLGVDVLSKVVLIVNICPDVSNAFRTSSFLDFFARSRVPYESRDTMVKLSDHSANALLGRKYEERDENFHLKARLAESLLVEQEQKILIQRHESMIQNLQSANVLLDRNFKEERDGNFQLKAQLGGALLAEQDQKTLIQQQQSMIQNLQSANALLDRNFKEVRDENFQLKAQLAEALLAGRDQKIFIQQEGSMTQKLQEFNQSSPSVEDPESCSNGVLLLGGDVNSLDGALVYTKVRKSPAGEYLIASLNDFDPDQYDSLAAISDGANKLLMLVLAAVIKAGASREHEMLAEIRASVCSFIRKMESKRVMDSMLVSRVRILYLRSLLARSPELQSIKVPRVSCFLEKADASNCRTSNPDRTMESFRVDIRREKKSRLSSAVLKVRGIDQETWRQHVTGEKLRALTEEARSFSVGNKDLAALFAHSPSGELQRRIRSWLAEHFDFLSAAVEDDPDDGQLELLTTAIMDGWMAGLGVPVIPGTDALGQLFSCYVTSVYVSHLMHLKDIGSTLAAEVPEDLTHVKKLRSALEAVRVKRKMVMERMKSDEVVLLSEDYENTSTSDEDARLASLTLLEGMLRNAKELLGEGLQTTPSRKKKEVLLEAIHDVSLRLPALLRIDYACALTEIEQARSEIRCIAEGGAVSQRGMVGGMPLAQWVLLQFNTGAASPVMLKCGGNSQSELVVKGERRVGEEEIVAVLPNPNALHGMTPDQLKELFGRLPEAVGLLTLARTADGTRARYSRLYRTLALKVPSLSCNPTRE